MQIKTITSCISTTDIFLEEPKDMIGGTCCQVTHLQRSGKPMITMVTTVYKSDQSEMRLCINNNNTPFNCTAKEENPDRNSHPLKDYYFRFTMIIAHCAPAIFCQQRKISYDEFKKIKYDQSFMNPAYNYAMINIEDILHLDKKNIRKLKSKYFDVEKMEQKL
jgi:hypothetical protein